MSIVDIPEEYPYQPFQNVQNNSLLKSQIPQADAYYGVEGRRHLRKALSLNCQ